MTTPAVFAAKDPDRPAVIYGDGEYVESYGQLEQRSRRLAEFSGSFFRKEAEIGADDSPPLDTIVVEEDPS